jgi:hypothetical protein
MKQGTGNCSIHAKITGAHPEDCSFDNLEAAIAADKMVVQCGGNNGSPGTSTIKNLAGRCKAQIKLCQDVTACM